MPEKSLENPELNIQRSIFLKTEPGLKIPSLAEMQASIKETDFLNPIQKNIMKLFLEGKNESEIATELKKSRQMVAGYIVRGKLVLNKIFGFEKGMVL